MHVARIRLSGLNRTIEIQVEIGPYRVDLLIDGWLVIEIDSEEGHSSERVADLRKAAWLPHTATASCTSTAAR